MRDLRKIKSKYEFKLDNKQIALLFGGALLVLVVVFALGVVVGKGLVQIQSVQESALLQEQVEAGLTTAPDPEVTPTPGELPDPLAMIADTPYPTPEPTPVPAVTGDGYIDILNTPPTPAPNDPPLPPVADTPPPSVNTPPIPTPAPAKGKFTIQLSSHADKVEADKRRNSYIGKGLTDVYVKPADVKGKTWYRVRTGHFATKDGAKQFAEAIKAKGIVADPWVTSD